MGVPDLLSGTPRNPSFGPTFDLFLNFLGVVRASGRARAKYNNTLSKPLRVPTTCSKTFQTLLSPCPNSCTPRKPQARTPSEPGPGCGGGSSLLALLGGRFGYLQCFLLFRGGGWEGSAGGPFLSGLREGEGFRGEDKYSSLGRNSHQVCVLS